MMIKLTEFDGDPILVNTSQVLYVRPANSVDKANSVLMLAIVSDNCDMSIYVQDTVDEIMQKMTMGTLF